MPWYLRCRCQKLAELTGGNVFKVGERKTVDGLWCVNSVNVGFGQEVEEGHYRLRACGLLLVYD